MSEPQTQSTGLVKKAETAVMEYVPFGGKDAIKLSLSIIKGVVAVPTKSGKVCTDRDAMKFMMLCQAQLLNPFSGDCFLVGYDKRNPDGSYSPQFSMITAHQAFLKRAETCPDFEGMESGIIIQTNEGVTEREGDFKLPDEKVVGGWSKVYRKGRKTTYRRLAVAAMKPNYPTPFWEGEKIPGQIVKCAEADALRATFPTLLGGLYHAGEILDVSATSRAIDMPTSSLVEVKSDGKAQIAQDSERQQPEDQRGGEQPPEDEEQETRSRRTTAVSTSSAKAELESIIIEAGFTFDDFQKWAKAEGHIPDADSLGSFEEVPEMIAKRLAKAKTGLIRGLQQAKAGGAA